MVAVLGNSVLYTAPLVTSDDDPDVTLLVAEYVAASPKPRFDLALDADVAPVPPLATGTADERFDGSKALTSTPVVAPLT